MKQILYILLIGIVITSCKKHKEERTEYLTQDQKDIIDAFKVGDTFTMQKTEIDDGITFIDTITFKVSRAGYGVASNGRWYENGGPETWTERGVVEFKSVNRVLWESGSIKVNGEKKDIINVNISAEIGTSLYKKTNNIFVGYNNNSTEEKDSSYFSLNKGIIKVWNSKLFYEKIN